MHDFVLWESIRFEIPKCTRFVLFSHQIPPPCRDFPFVRECTRCKILYFERVQDLRYPNVRELYCFVNQNPISHLYENVRDARFFYFERVQDLKYPNVRDLYCSNEWNHGEKIVRVWTRIRELIESDRGIEKCSSVNEDWISPRYENVYRILRLLVPPPPPPSLSRNFLIWLWTKILCTFLSLK